MAQKRKEQGDQLMQRIGEAGITLVDWDIQHYIALGVPLVDSGSRVFLVPDGDLAVVRDAAAELDMVSYKDSDQRLDYLSCMPTKPLQFPLGDTPKWTFPNSASLTWLVFAPMSSTGIRPDELMPRDQMTFEPRTPRGCLRPDMPAFVKTISIGSTCAALLRITARFGRGSPLRSSLLVDLTAIVGYCLFDLSYDGMYMDIPGNGVPLSDQEKADMEVAVADIRAWQFREDEAGLQEFLVQAVRGEKNYRDLPGLEDEASSV